MTFAMSTEGDSVKSALSEANDKNATDNHTDDSSQDSVDAKEIQAAKPVENNINSEKNEKPKDDSTEGESDPESETSEKKDEAKASAQNEEKPVENDNKSEGDEGELKKNNKEAKSEEDEEGEEEEEEEEEEEKPPSKKDEKPAKESKNSKDVKDKDEKASTASDKDEEEDEVEEEEEEEEEEEKKPEKKGKKKGVPLLDQPLEKSGKRERKNVQKFEEDDVKKESTREPAKVEIEEGSGTPLGEIPRVDAALSRFRDDLKVLHKMLFKVPGTKPSQKKNIKNFNGFAFKKDSDEYKKKVEALKKIEVKHLKATCDLLDLAKNGSKDDLVDRLMDFLMEPKESGKPVGGTGRPKRASAVRANNRGYSSHDDYSSDDNKASRGRRDKGKRTNLKDDSSSDEEFKPGDASDASDEKPRAVRPIRKRGRTKKGSSDDDDVSLSGSSDDSDAPKTKRRKSITKSNSKVKPKTSSRRGRPSKAAAPTPRSTPKRGRKAKDVSSDEEEDKADDGSSSEDEPLVKKKTKSAEPPTDDEIKTFIKNVLEGANLEEITMKTVCQRVYDNYPEFDLTARKNFIKATVKSLIST